MPELKRNFSQGKMNKDLDERLLPPGEYRDANNIQVSTSDGSDVGSVQTLLGNSSFITSTPSLPPNCVCVGAISDEKNDKLYWLVQGPSPFNSFVCYDFILEVDVEFGVLKYVVVDNYQTVITTSTSTVGNAGGTLTFAPSLTQNTVRAGMYATFNDSSGQPQRWEVLSFINDVATLAPLNGVAVSLEVNINESITFTADRVLRFKAGRIVTAMNIIDDNLFWTDNQTEPKKINITRCKLGTGKLTIVPDTNIASDIPSPNSLKSSPFNGENYNIHTRLVATLDDSIGPEVITNAAGTKAVFLEEQHITVIRKNPVTPLYLQMSSTNVERFNSDGEPNSILATVLSTKFTDANGFPLAAGADKDITFQTAVDFRIGDVLTFKSVAEQSTPSDFIDYIARGVVTAIPAGHQPPDGLIIGVFTITMSSVSSSALDNEEPYSAILEQSKPLFEFKFPRFSYRYKYVDGEYSTFAPWSEIAFIPGNFDYLVKQGYNLAMTNRVRSLTLKNYIVEDSLRPRDVVEVDILYKESNSPLCYTVKTLKPKDGSTNPLVWPNTSTSPYARGEFEIESEMIHAVVASNQLLRPWDNVPRKALAQEVTGNRLVYANYLQNYNLTNGTSLIRPQLDVSLLSSPNTNFSTDKSIKTMRTYQVGIVYGDEYGRETPVLTDQLTGSITVPKEECINFSKMQVKINSEAPDWARTWKFYVKETSNEYYNLVMDRWYDALDGNVWISFPSAERNKIDDETFLILKKQHDNSNAVVEAARYKVIAIESDAPEFIKKKRESLGVVTNTSWLGVVDNIIGDSSSGFPFVNQNFFTITQTQSQDIWGSGYWTEEKLEVRITSSDGSKSLWYEVAKASPVGNNEVNFLLKKKFGDDVLFATTDDPQTWANRLLTSNSTTLQVELAKTTIENKPEFDGRFFVKIYKDLVLKDNVLGSSDTEDLVITSASSIRYINTLEQDIGSIAAQTAGTIPTSPVGQQGSGVNHVPGKYTYVVTNSNGGSSVAFHTWVNTLSQFYNTGGEDNNHQQAKAFWEGFSLTNKNHDKGNFFIDQAAVRPDTYGITVNGVSTTVYAGLKGCGHNVPHGNGVGSMTSGGGQVFVHPDAGTLVLDAGVQVTQTNGLNQVATINGKGIHAQNYAIDIAFSGIWPYGAEDGKPGIVNRLQDAVATKPQYEQDVAFANALFTIGARFRFKNDPNKTVYTVIHVRELYGLRNYKPQSHTHQNDNCKDKDFEKGPNYAANKRHRWTLVLDKAIGDQTHSPILFWPLDVRHDGTQGQTIEVLQAYNEDGSSFSEDPAVWETEPKEDVGLDIYYEATQAYPMDIDFKTNEQFIPVSSLVKYNNSNGDWVTVSNLTPALTVRTYSVSDQKVTLDSTSVALSVGDVIRFEHPDGGAVHAKVATAVSAGDTTIVLSGDGQDNDPTKRPHNQNIILPYFNCYSFGNGVESDRIRDDYNQVKIGKGVKASTVLAEQFKEERRSSGLIFSGIYNSNSGVNRLNQFIQAEPITKDLNPSYGSIQKLYSRDGDLITFCEDKVLKITANKDAIFNADGNPQLVASNKVLGQAIPYVGDYGISKNPESFAVENYRMYFTDKQRGAVLRLSRDGMTSISEYGMRDWFKTNFGQVGVSHALGSYDKDKSVYNLTLKTTTEKGSNEQSSINYTLSYKESVRGWQSFHSFTPEFAISSNNKYFTFKDGLPWRHHVNAINNNYYNIQYYSDITLILNDMPGAVKSFNTVNYEGTQTRVVRDVTDGNYHNLASKQGWYLESFITDLQTGAVPEFIDKEGKWFNYLKGDTTTLDNLDATEISVQGLGNPSSVSHDGPSNGSGDPFKLYVDDSSTGTNGDGWDDGNTYT